MVFNIKTEDFKCKARTVTGDVMTKAPETITYSNVQRDMVRIALMAAALNNLR